MVTKNGARIALCDGPTVGHQETHKCSTQKNVRCCINIILISSLKCGLKNKLGTLDPFFLRADREAASYHVCLFAILPPKFIQENTVLLRRL